MSDGLLEPTGGPDPRIGMVLQERYRIVRLLGEGGMGAVYEGEHVLIKKRVAIKCLHAQFAQNPEIVARFHREALAATSIGHANIVEVTDMGRFPDGSVFMVLEYLDGRDWVDDIDNEGPQPVGKTIDIMLPVCEALTAAHDKGIIHRDLKPENIFLIKRGSNPNFPKIVDFGISKFKDGAGKGMTQTGTTLGTPYYMSPEQAQGKSDVDARADIYSLGVILFQALTAQYPFDDESYPMLVLKICTEPPPPLRNYRPDLPEALVDVVAKCLRKDREERYPSTAALAAALAPFRTFKDTPEVSVDAPATSSLSASALTGAALANTMASGETAVPANTPVTSPMAESAVTLPGKSKAPLIGGVLGLVAVLGIGAFFASQGAGDDPTPVTPTPIGSQTMEAIMAANMANTPPGMGAEPAQPQQPAQSVTVQITTTPEDAEVYLDGDRIPNPFDGELPQTNEPRRLEVRAEGYVTKAQDLVLSFPQRVRITLDQGEGMDDRSSVMSSPRRHRRPRDTPRPPMTTPMLPPMVTPMETPMVTPMEAPMVTPMVTPMVGPLKTIMI